MINLRVCATAFVILFIGVPAPAGDTLESVEKAVIESCEKITSLQYKARSVSDFESEGYKYKSEMEGEYWYKKQGDKVFFRMEATTDQLMGQAGQEQKSKTISTMVCDGEFMYSLSEANGEKSAMKQNIMTQGWITDKSYFNNLRQGSKLKLLPDETVDGRSTYVIEATPKEAPPANQSGTTAVSFMYFDKETGLVIKWLSKDASGKVVSTSVTTDLKVNSTISADRFVFKAPEGVEVMDLTKMQQQTAEPAQAEQEKPAPAEEAEKPKEPEQKDESKEPEKKDEAEEPEKSEKRDKPKLPDLPKPKWP